MRLSVPGNLLLLGEYAVLEEGGLGLTLAVERRAHVTVRPGRGLEILGTWGSGSARWTPAEPAGSPLFSAAVSCLQDWHRQAGLPAPRLDARIEIDSSAYFRPDGGKRGFGGSAAVSVGLACALLHACGQEEAARSGQAALLALAAHRASQGGSGSGYDVMCSFHGGMGLFRGGAEPSWRPCCIPWDPAFFLFAGPSPVSTPEAIRSYAAWKEREPAAASRFLHRSNELILAFLEARTPEEAGPCFAASRDLGVAHGEAIGVDACITGPAPADPSWCKSLGAGNELGVWLAPPGTTTARPAQPGLERVTPAQRGVVWEG